jgi:hypothetical protein
MNVLNNFMERYSEQDFIYLHLNGSFKEPKSVACDEKKLRTILWNRVCVHTSLSTAYATTALRSRIEKLTSDGRVAALRETSCV